MDLIERLDIRKDKNGKKRRRWGRFFCPYCKNEVEKVVEVGLRQMSCGCAGGKIRGEMRVIHGDARKGNDSRIYTIFYRMRDRCGNPKNSKFKYYGGRKLNPVTICNEWEDNFLAFKKWALKNGYNDSLQIDRIDNAKGYLPSNCRFVTSIENSRNKKSVKLSAKIVKEIRSRYASGKYTLKKLGKEYDVHPATIGKVVNHRIWVL